VRQILFFLIILNSCKINTSQSTASGTSKQINPDGKLKAVWITSGSEALTNPAKSVSNICNSNLNTVNVPVYTRGKAWYRSTQAKSWQALENPHGRDFLREFIDEVKKCDRPLKVVAWFEYGLRVPKNVDKSYGEHWEDLANTIERDHPEWLFKETFNRVQEPRFDHAFLDPRIDGVRKFILGLVDEVLSYEVSAINIDDNFSVAQQACSDDSVKDAIASLIGEIYAKAAEKGKKFIYSPLFKVRDIRTTWNIDYSAIARGKDSAKFEVYPDRYESEVLQVVESANKFKAFAPTNVDIFKGFGLLAGTAGNEVDPSIVAQNVKNTLQAGLGVSLFYYDYVFKDGYYEKINEALQY